MEGNLKENGWFLSEEGVAECQKACTKEKPTVSDCLKAAANLDLRQYGKKTLSDELTRGKLESIKGPIVLQVQKIRNISAPKANEESNHAPRLLKLLLTDGHMTCHGLEMSSIPQLSLSTPPGTKICLTGPNIPAQNGFILMNSGNTKVLGGEVEKLAAKWQLNKSLAQHSRKTVSTEGGPPPFVPFGAGKSAANTGRTHCNEKNKDSANAAMNNIQKPSDRNSKEPSVASRAKPNETDKNQRSRRNQLDGKENYYKKENDRGERGSYNPRQRPNNSNSQEPRKVNHERAPARSGREDRDKDSDRVTSSGALGVNDQPSRKPAFEQSRAKGNAQSDRPNSSRSNQERVSLLSRGDNSKLSEEGAAPVYQGGRGGRGGPRNARFEQNRRDTQGKGRGSDFGASESEGYRTRQPSQQGTLWDYLESKMPESKKKSTNPTAPSKDFAENSQQKQEDVRNSHVQGDRKQDIQVSRERETPNSKDSCFTENKSDKMEKERQFTRDVQIKQHPKGPSEPQTRSNMQQKTSNQQQGTRSEPQHHHHQQQQQQQQHQQQHQQQQQQQQQHHQQQHHQQHHQHPKQHQRGDQQSYQRQQQSTGRPSGRGSKGRYEDSRQHQTLPPRLQKKHQQQHHQYVKEFLQQEKQNLSQRKDSSTPPQQSGSPSQYEGSGKRHSPHNPSRTEPSHRHYTGAQQQGRKQRSVQGQQQQIVDMAQSYDPGQQVEQRFSPSEYQQQSQYGASGSPQGHSQTPYSNEQMAVQYDPQGTPREYQLQQQQPQMTPQAITMYQVPTTHMQQVAATPQMIPQHALQQQQPPVASQMQAPQTAWKKGDFCLSIWRDGQCYSAKIDDILPDGSNCKITFLDFGNSEVVPLNTLSSIPIVTWSEANRVQAPAVSTVALPVYAAPQSVSIVPRPQMMIPVSRAPSYPVAARPVVPQATQVLPQQVQWQPQMTYEMRPQGYQPQVIQYGAIPQPNNTVSQGQAYFQSVAPSGMQYVAQNDVISGTTGVEIESARNLTNTNPGYSKHKRQGKQTQQFYVAPRHQKARENTSNS